MHWPALALAIVSLFGTAQEARFRGTVVDTERSPVAGATIYVTPELSFEQLFSDEGDRAFFEAKTRTGTLVATSDARGQFELQGSIDPEAQYFLIIDHPSWVRHYDHAPTPEGAAPIDLGVIGLRPGLTLSGVVRDSAGEPLAGAAVVAALGEDCDSEIMTIAESVSVPHRRTTTDKAGRFTLRGLRACEYVIRASLAGLVPSAEELFEPGGEDAIEISLSNPRTLWGLVTDSAENPLAGVRVEYSEIGWGSSSEPGKVETDADGRFVIEGIGWEQTRVIARHSGYAIGLRAVQSTRDRELTIQLQRAGTLDGQIIDAVSSDPITAATIRLEPIDPNGTRDKERRRQEIEIDQQQGLFTIGDLDPGSFRVEVKTGHLFTRRADIEIQSGENVLKEPIRIPPLGSVSGRIIDDSGATVAGASVTLSFGKPKDPTDLLSQLFGNAVTEVAAVTDEAGRFELDGIDPGRFTIVANSQLHAPADPIGRELAPAETIDGIQITLVRAGVIEVTLLLDGEPADGWYSVKVAGPLDDDTRLIERSIDRDGVARFDALRPGAYVAYVESQSVEELNADAWDSIGVTDAPEPPFKSSQDPLSSEGLGGQPVRVTVQVGEVTRCNLNWDPPRVLAAVRVGEQPATGVVCAVLDATSGEVVKEDLVEANGQYARLLPAGDYLLLAWYPGHPFAQRIEMATRAERPARVEISFPETSLAVKLDSPEGPIEGATARLEVLEFGDVPEDQPWIIFSDQGVSPYPFEPRLVSAGKVEVPYLLPGRYRVTIEAEGRESVQREITIENSSVQLDIQLK